MLSEPSNASASNVGGFVARQYIVVNVGISSNAHFSILVTDAGISTEFLVVGTLLIAIEAYPMVVTVSGITVISILPKINLLVDVSIIALQLSRESYAGLPDATDMDCILHPTTIYEPMLVTDVGMLIDVNPDLENALFPMLETLSGMVIDVNPDLENALFPMLETPVPKFTVVRFLQFWKAPYPMTEALFGMAIEVKPTQL